MSAELWIVGAPLDESLPLSAAAGSVVQRAQMVIGENRSVTSRYLKPIFQDDKAPEIYFLDPVRQDERDQIRDGLKKLAKSGGTAVLLSDVGMPILFDPGSEVLAWAKDLGFTIRCVPGPTSWSIAAAISSFPPPLQIVGFLPREEVDRGRRLKSLINFEGACVFMETPYRFRLLLKQVTESFGPKRDAFLAWEIGKAEERYLWGTLAQLEQAAIKHQLNKGEFILVTGPRSSKPRS